MINVTFLAQKYHSFHFNRNDITGPFSGDGQFTPAPSLEDSVVRDMVLTRE